MVDVYQSYSWLLKHSKVYKPWTFPRVPPWILCATWTSPSPHAGSACSTHFMPKLALFATFSVIFASHCNLLYWSPGYKEGSRACVLWKLRVWNTRLGRGRSFKCSGFLPGGCSLRLLRNILPKIHRLLTGRKEHSPFLLQVIMNCTSSTDPLKTIYIGSAWHFNHSQRYECLSTDLSIGAVWQLANFWNLKPWPLPSATYNLQLARSNQ